MENLLAAYQQEFNTLQPTLSGQSLPWLQKQRQAGLAYLLEKGFPSSQQEAWKYTSIAALLKQHLPVADRLDDKLLALDPDTYALLPSTCHRLVFINGYYAAQFSSLAALPKGVILASLANQLNTGNRQLALYAGQHFSTQHGFAAANQVFSQDGLYLYVPAGIDLVEPIEVLAINTQAHRSVYMRNLIIMGEGSKACVLENYSSINERLYLNNVVTECILESQSQLQHIKLQQEAPTASHMGVLAIQQHNNSQLNAYSFNFGGKLVRQDTQVLLAEEQAHCNLQGLYLAREQQHIDQHTEIIHQQAYTTSREYYKGILDDHSRGVFNGRIEVKQEAQKTDAKLNNKNLLLSNHAEIDTKPELEIYADDVKCAHGATVGQLNEQALFYLCSRGMDEVAARSVLIYAFAAEVLNTIKDKPLHTALQKCLLQYLPSVLAYRELL